MAFVSQGSVFHIERSDNNRVNVCYKSSSIQAVGPHKALFQPVPTRLLSILFGGLGLEIG